MSGPTVKSFRIPGLKTTFTEVIKREDRPIGEVKVEPMKVKIARELDLLISHYGPDACKDRIRGYEKYLERS